MESSQQLCLRWDKFQNNVTSVFDYLRQDEELVDITLCCEGVKVKAHRMMLSACSPYFRDLLKDNPCQHMVIFLKDTSAADLRFIVEFMYTGSVNIAQSQLASFIKTAEMLQIRGLSGDDEEKSCWGPSEPSDVTSPERCDVTCPEPSPPLKRRRRSGSWRPGGVCAADRADSLSGAVRYGGEWASPPPPQPPAEPEGEGAAGSGHSDSASRARPARAELAARRPEAARGRASREELELPSGAEREPEQLPRERPEELPQELPEPGVKLEDVDLVEEEDAVEGDAAVGLARLSGALAVTEDVGKFSGGITVTEEEVEDGDDAAAGHGQNSPVSLNFTSHQEDIQSPGPYFCPLCGRGYTNSRSLDYHRKMHEGLTTCIVCGKVASKVEHLRRHLVRVHKMSEAEIRTIVPTRTRGRGQRGGARL